MSAPSSSDASSPSTYGPDAPAGGSQSEYFIAASSSSDSQARTVLQWLREKQFFTAHRALEKESGVVDVSKISPCLLLTSGSSVVLRTEVGHLRDLILDGSWLEVEHILRAAICAAANAPHERGAAIDLSALPPVDGIADPWGRVFYPLREQQLLEMLDIAAQRSALLALSDPSATEDAPMRLDVAAILRASSVASPLSPVGSTSPSFQSNAFVRAHGFAPPLTSRIPEQAPRQPTAAPEPWQLSDFAGAVTGILRDLSRLAPLQAYTDLCSCLPAARPGDRPATYAGWSVAGGRLAASEAVLAVLGEVAGQGPLPPQAADVDFEYETHDEDVATNVSTLPLPLPGLEHVRQHGDGLSLSVAGQNFHGSPFGPHRSLPQSLPRSLSGVDEEDPFSASMSAALTSVAFSQSGTTADGLHHQGGGLRDALSAHGHPTVHVHSGVDTSAADDSLTFSPSHAQRIGRYGLSPQRCLSPTALSSRAMSPQALSPQSSFGRRGSGSVTGRKSTGTASVGSIAHGQGQGYAYLWPSPFAQVGNRSNVALSREHGGNDSDGFEGDDDDDDDDDSYGLFGNHSRQARHRIHPSSSSVAATPAELAADASVDARPGSGALLLGPLDAPVRTVLPLPPLRYDPDIPEETGQHQWALVGSGGPDLSIIRVPPRSEADAANAAGSAACKLERRFPDYHDGALRSLALWRLSERGPGQVPPAARTLDAPPCGAKALRSAGAAGLVAIAAAHNVVKVSVLVASSTSRAPTLGAHAHLVGHTGSLRALAFQPHSSALLYSGGGGDFAVRLWDCTRAQFAAPTSPVVLTSADSACLGLLRGHTGVVKDLSVAECAPALVASAGSDGFGYLWDTRAGLSPVWSTPLQTPLTAAALAPWAGGSALALYFGHDDGSVSAWDMRTSYSNPWYLPAAAAAGPGAASGGSLPGCPLPLNDFLRWRAHFNGIEVRSLRVVGAARPVSFEAARAWAAPDASPNVALADGRIGRSVTEVPIIAAAPLSGPAVALDGAAGVVLRAWGGVGSQCPDKWTCVCSIPGRSDALLAASARGGVHALWTGDAKRTLRKKWDI